MFIIGIRFLIQPGSLLEFIPKYYMKFGVLISQGLTLPLIGFNLLGVMITGKILIPMKLIKKIPSCIASIFNFISAPIWGCLVCMSSFWGVVFATIAIPEQLFLDTLYNIPKYIEFLGTHIEFCKYVGFLIYCISLCGLLSLIAAVQGLLVELNLYFTLK